MPYDPALRHQQALDPSSLTTVANSLHAITAAIEDCRNDGRDAEQDPAVLLLAQHLGTVATEGRPASPQLRRSCMDEIAALKRTPALTTLIHKGVAYDAEAKTLFHAEGRKAMLRLADALLLAKGTYDVRSNKAGPAVSGEITLHSDEAYVQLSIGCTREVMFRSVRSRQDYTGGPNHWASINELLAPDRFAARLRRELRLSTPIAEPTRLFA